jgi:hypothetical protein
MMTAEEQTPNMVNRPIAGTKYRKHAKFRNVALVENFAKG